MGYRPISYQRSSEARVGGRSSLDRISGTDKDEMRVRRRIRGKQPVRMVEGEDRVRLRRLLREESGSLDVDE